MRKLAGYSALFFAILLILLILCFNSLEWSIKSVIITVFSLFLGFCHTMAIRISRKGLLQKILLGTFVIQFVLVLLLVLNIIEIKSLWYLQSALVFTSICIGIISSTTGRKISPLIYYLQYLVLAIIVFCLFGLGMNPISIGTVTIGFSLVCLLGIVIQLFTREKSSLYSK